MAEPLGPIVDAGRAIEVNKVLRSTYLLLAMAIGFAALTAFIGIAMGLPFMLATSCRHASAPHSWR